MTVQVRQPLGAHICQLANRQNGPAFWLEPAQACGYTVTLLTAQHVPVATEAPRLAKEMRGVTDLARTLADVEAE